jgi:hypothetical protein
MTKRRKTSSTLVKKAMAAMSRGGMTLTRKQLQELRLAFSNLSESDVSKLIPENDADETIIAYLKRELRAANGTAKVFVGYLSDVLSERGLSVPKAASSTMSGLCAYAEEQMTAPKLRASADEALKRYKSDYDTSYRLRTG